MTRLVLLAAALLVALASGAFADTLSGSLTGENDGLVGTGLWVTNPYGPSAPPDLLTDVPAAGDGGLSLDQPTCEWDPPTISWSVMCNIDGSWHYTYDLDVYNYNFNRFILETSRSFTCNDIYNVQGDFTAYAIDWWSPGSTPGNPNMPEAVYGIKFTTIGTTNLDISFDSTRAPVWGDFYARDGKVSSTWNTVRNAGFTSPDWDPTVAPSNGSVFNHILVPDSECSCCGVIPEPGTMALLGLGLAGLGARLRRRRS